MNLAQALEHAHAIPLPGFAMDTTTLDQERRDNEEAIGLLMAAWQEAPAGAEPFSFDLVRELADRNRALCDLYDNDEYLQNASGGNLARSLSQADIVHGIAKIQHRSDKKVASSAGMDLTSLGVAITEADVSGTVLGVDIETTSRFPDRGYIINLGLAFMQLDADAKPHDGHTAYFGLPAVYAEKGVPLERIHHISWADVEGKEPFRTNAGVHKALLRAFKSAPVMAHNAAFEDSWFMLHLDGYAEARKAGKIAIVDSREICRRIDPDVRSLPRESSPAALENWARRRGTLAEGEVEKHLGLDDVFLMLETVREEFRERNTLA